MDVHIENCCVGIEMLGTFSDKQGVSSLILTDWFVSHTSQVVQLENHGSGRLVLDHVVVDHVESIVQGHQRAFLEPRGDRDTIKYWVKAPASVSPTPVGLERFETPEGPVYMGHAPAPVRPECLVDDRGCWFGQEKPAYDTWLPIVNIRAYGAKGDGKSDDTKAIQAALDANIGRVVFVPYGIYAVFDTIHIPVGTRLVGEAQPIILGVGDAFQNAEHPCPVVRVGHPGDRGDLILADLVFSTCGNTPGAVVMEWNVHERTKGSVGMFDAHIRIGGFRGSEQELVQCSKYAKLKELPRAAALSLHITQQASGYFQNVWIWTADHELDDGCPEQLNVLTDRGVLIESRGPVWMYGTASEHAVLYQYSLHQASNVLLAMIQTESPYFQGHNFERASESVSLGAPFPDPDCARKYRPGLGLPAWPHIPEMEDRALGLQMTNCHHIYVLGSGQYSFFDSYNQTALADHACQRRLCVVDNSSDVWIVNLASVGTQTMISIDGTDYALERPFREGFCSTMALCVLQNDRKTYIV